MASKFRIVASRHLGLETCEFDVTVAEGEVLRGETFIIIDSGSPWQYIVTGIRPAGSDLLTLEVRHMAGCEWRFRWRVVRIASHAQIGAEDVRQGVAARSAVAVHV